MRSHRSAALLFAATLECSGPDDLGVPDDLVTCDEPLAPTLASCGDGKRTPGEICFLPEQVIEDSELIWRHRQAAVADFNGDGHLDLMRGRSIYAGDGSGTFPPLATMKLFFGSPFGGNEFAAAGDYNGDGIADVALGSFHPNCFPYDPMSPPDYKFILVWFGNPTWAVQGYWTLTETNNYPISLAIIPGTPGHGGLLLVGFDECDVIGCLERRWYRFDSHEHPLTPWESEVDTCYAGAADLDDDGVIDINTDEHEVLMGEGGGTYTPVKNHPRPFGTRFGWDLDCDGVTDAIDVGWSDFDFIVDLWRGLGGGRYHRIGAVLGGDVRDTVLADINGDGDGDIIACTAEGVVARSGGPGLTFAPALNLLAGPCDQILAADLNEDGATDLVLFERNTTYDTVTKLRIVLAGT